MSAHASDPSDLGVLRELADERRRRGLELLPAIRRPIPWLGRAGRVCALESIWSAFGGQDAWERFIDSGPALDTLPDPLPGWMWMEGGEQNFPRPDGTILVQSLFFEIPDFFERRPGQVVDVSRGFVQINRPENIVR